MGLIQFKRVLNCHSLGYAEALYKIKNEVGLEPGEPMICSYNEGGECKYMFVVKTANTLHSVPMFESLEAVEEFIKNNASAFNWDSVSEESDIKVSNDSGNITLTLKDEYKNKWINLNEQFG